MGRVGDLELNDTRLVFAFKFDWERVLQLNPLLAMVPSGSDCSGGCRPRRRCGSGFRGEFLVGENMLRGCVLANAIVHGPLMIEPLSVSSMIRTLGPPHRRSYIRTYVYVC